MPLFKKKGQKISQSQAALRIVLLDDATCTFLFSNDIQQRNQASQILATLLPVAKSKLKMELEEKKRYVSVCVVSIVVCFFFLFNIFFNKQDVLSQTQVYIKCTRNMLRVN
jgi:hypothetical protein